jgi:hypothetical protein
MRALSNFFFTFRRLILILGTVNLIDYPSVEIMLYTFLSILYVTYLLYYKPYEEMRVNKLEVFNELCVLTSSYVLYLQTDFVDGVVSSQVKSIGGMLLIGITLINFLINLSVILMQTVQRGVLIWQNRAQIV